MIRRVLVLAPMLLFAACSESVVGPVSQDGGFVAITAGTHHTCGLTVSGLAFCWGEGVTGQLGDAQYAMNLVPSAVLGGLLFTQISAGSLHTCGLEVDGTVHCWGSNLRGQIGNTSNIPQGAPVPVHIDQQFTSVASGWLHTCASTAAGEVYCWGSNGQGQAGGGGGDVLAPRLVPTDVELGRLTAGGFHTCGLDATGAAYCWGSNTLGQLGTGATDDSSTPTAVVNGHRFSQLSAGYTHTCGLRVSDGRVMCWGSALHGEIGTAGTAPTGIAGAMWPQRIAVDQEFIDVEAGYYATCASTVAGVIWCWGRGDDGQLGYGGYWDQPYPQRVRNADAPAQSGVLKVTVGQTHSCGVNRYNVAICWGNGAHGQLGWNKRVSSPIAVRVRME